MKRNEEDIKGYENIKLTALDCYESQVELFGKKQVKKLILQYHKNWSDSLVYFTAEPSLI